MSDDPITLWIEGLKQGENSSVEQIWRQYFERMVALAQQKLGGSLKRSNDEEDIALSAFHSLCQGAARGNFPKLTDRNSLWPLLACITARKAYDAIQRQGRKKRGGGNVRCETELAGSDGLPFIMDQLLSREPTPQEATLMNEECSRLLSAVGANEQRVVLLKLEGHTNDEIAGQLGVTPRTVERKLELIRRTWTDLAN